MDIKALLGDAGERPLDRLVDDGGFAALFRTFACVGDSLASGEFETLDESGGRSFHDLFEYSWGQYMARAMGSKAYNFSRGGMTAKVYMESFAEEMGYWDPAKACQAYILALGVNDVSMAMREGWPIGDMADVKDDWRDNAKTFAGYYGAIIQRYRAISPDAKFFLLTMPVMPDRPAERVPLEEEHTRLIHAMAARFDKTYVIDLRKYAPVYDAAFKEAFFLNGHLNPCGYILTAKMVMSYMDYIIRHNMDDFREAGLIGTPFKNVRQGDRA